MYRSLLIGVVAGMRALSPLAAVSFAASRGRLLPDNGAPTLLGKPAVAASVMAVAIGELIGDKLPSAPDRIVAPGMAARITSGAVAAASLAPREQRPVAALIGAVAAVGASYVTFDARVRAIHRYGQVRTGLIEDLIVVGSAWWIVHAAWSAASRR